MLATWAVLLLVPAIVFVAPRARGDSATRPPALYEVPRFQLPPAGRGVEQDGRRAPPIPRRSWPDRLVQPARDHRFPVRVPGEFEKQSGILIACHDLVQDLPEVFVQIVDATRGSVDLFALVNHSDQRQTARSALARQNVVADHVTFLTIPHDTMWTRDYGPVLVWQRNGQVALLDAAYGHADRMNDDSVAYALAQTFRLPLAPINIYLEGGNLLTNGEGIFAATRTLLEMNQVDFVDGEAEEKVQAELNRSYGSRQVVWLEPLQGEPTGHVDMFATFTSPTTVIVASISPADDPENASVLDRNAQQLARVRTSQGRLRVVRIPMPSHADGVWRSYTNVAYANGVLLVPVYGEKDVEVRKSALATFARELPGWRIVPVDCEQLAFLGGAIHCITRNIPGTRPLTVVRFASSTEEEEEERSTIKRSWAEAPRPALSE